ncbi:BfmA/BtgA family mobilization protein [Sinomicrobium sp. M5D2P17]
MDIGYEKEAFEGLKIKTSVAQKFRKYCKKLSQSQSMSLLLMLEFFEYNEVSPKDVIGPNMQTLESVLEKRINAVVSIVKDIEKHQTQPTVEMLQSLFENTSPAREPKKKLWQEKKTFPKQKDGKPLPLDLQLEETREERDYYKNCYSRLERKFSVTQQDLKKVLNNIKLVRPPLTKSYFRVEITPKELKYIKENLY